MLSTQAPRIVVVGAGIGGLSCAIALAAQGCRVTVIERGREVGGKARGREVGSATLDAGPTVLTMPWVFDELFAASGASFRDEVGLERAEVLARHAWPDGTRLDLFADGERTAQAIGEAFGTREATAFRAFARDAAQIYATVEGPFLRAERPTVSTLFEQVGRLGLKALARVDAHRTMARALAKAFASLHLRQLFGRYATYVGSSPFEAPATLNLIAHVESEGVYRVRGGMRAIPKALEARASALGVAIVRSAEVERIVVEGGRTAGVVAEGEVVRADAVVFNGDVSALAMGLAGEEVRKAVESAPSEGRSLSALTWSVVGRTSGLPLLHHNVLFADPSEYRAELEAVLVRKGVPGAPTVYVCAQDRGDVPLAEGSGEERLLVLVNAPATGDAPWRWSLPEILRCEKAMSKSMERCGLSIETSAVQRTTPIDYHRRFPATGGALYGPIARGPLSAFARASARTRVPGLYLAGGSVHPGPGVPMAALSGRTAAARVLEDFASTARSATAAISGTTSTPSARTVATPSS